MATAVKISNQSALPNQPSETPGVPDANSAALLIDARSFAALMAVSLATFHRMKVAGKLPRPIELSAGCHRWRLAEVRDWIDAGCPCRKEWDALRR
jgi:predicted DNA-binding transcriptional regulator AlpA